MDSKEYSWAWIEADQLLSHGPCELIFADVEPSAANGRCRFRNGEGTGASIIHVLKTSANTNITFRPSKPVYCSHGIFVDIDEKVSSVFIQWRELKNEERGG